MYLGNTGLFFPNHAYGTASTNVTTSSLQPMNITKIPIIQKNQTENQTAKAQNYNSTDTTISSFRSGNKLLIQAINDIKIGNIHDALINLNNAKVMIEQQQLAALDVMSNPKRQESIYCQLNIT